MSKPLNESDIGAKLIKDYEDTANKRSVATALATFFSNLSVELQPANAHDDEGFLALREEIEKLAANLEIDMTAPAEEIERAVWTKIKAHVEHWQAAQSALRKEGL